MPTSSNRMIVVQMIDSLKRGGGAESLVFYFAKEARSHGIQCHIVTIRDNDADLAEELRQEGVTVMAFPGRKLINPLRLWRILRYLKSIKPEVVHTHLSGASILGTVAARFAKIPAVVSLHNVKVASQQHLYHGRLESWLMQNWTDHIIAVGDRTAVAHASKVGDTPMSVILNAVRQPAPMGEEEIRTIRDQVFPGFPGPILATVGSLTEQKGYANLIRTLADVDAVYRCMIIGDGPLRGELTDLVSSLGLQEKIEFMGLRPDVNALLKSSDIYVSSSLWEGLPVATLEAMYAGLPVVSTAVGDAENVLREGAGILVNANDNPGLGQAITQLLTNQKLRNDLAARSFERVDTEYNIHSWMNKLKDIYLSVGK